MTISTLTNWVIANRTGKAFKDYSHQVIANEIQDGIDSGTFRYCTCNDEIVGVVCSQLMPDNTLFVHDVLTTRKGVIVEFIREFEKAYPTYRLAGFKPKQNKNRIWDGQRYTNLVKLTN